MTIQILITILLIPFIHWIADFVLQSDKQARNKNKSWFYLIEHTLTYSIVWLVISFLWFLCHLKVGVSNDILVLKCLSFWIITFICHTLTDYFTSRLNARLWEQGKVHNFFVSVGFDQFLHYAQLFITYYLLAK